MGLFSRKSPEEKRLKKFEKTEKQVNKRLKFAFVVQGGVLPPISELFILSTNKEEYDKVNDYFKTWIDNSVYLKYDRLSKVMWFERDSWFGFSKNCFYGFVGLMLANQYNTCLEYINKVLEMETAIYRVKVNLRQTGGFKATFGNTMTNNPQINSFNEFRFMGGICLYELNQKELALDIFKQFPEDYSFYVLSKYDKYYKTNFKYAEGIHAKDFIELINQSNP